MQPTIVGYKHGAAHKETARGCMEVLSGGTSFQGGERSHDDDDDDDDDTRMLASTAETSVNALVAWTCIFNCKEAA